MPLQIAHARKRGTAANRTADRFWRPRQYSTRRRTAAIRGADQAQRLEQLAGSKALAAGFGGCETIDEPACIGDGVMPVVFARCLLMNVAASVPRGCSAHCRPGGGARSHVVGAAAAVQERRAHGRGLRDGHRRRRPPRPGSHAGRLRDLRQRQAADRLGVLERHPADHHRRHARSQREHAGQQPPGGGGRRGVRGETAAGRQGPHRQLRGPDPGRSARVHERPVGDAADPAAPSCSRTARPRSGMRSTSG